ncbi:MAG: phosphatase PAP2 family protein [Candidatus Saccharimonas sp.]
MYTLKHWLKVDNLSLVLLFIVFWVPVIVFLKLAGEVIEKEPIAFDTVIINWLHAHANPFLDSFFLVFTNIGGVIGIVTITILLVTYLLYKKQRRNSLLLVAGVGGAAVANLILKALFQRDRPSLFDPSVVETSFSFPSGHAMASSALILCVILIFWHTKWRWLVTLIGAIVVLAISVSRLYLGVHYPTDIIAGWCASTAWVAIVFFASKKLRPSALTM